MVANLGQTQHLHQQRFPYDKKLLQLNFSNACRQKFETFLSTSTSLQWLETCGSPNWVLTTEQAVKRKEIETQWLESWPSKSALRL